MPNAWDIGSAVLLASLGFEALATTSGGFAASKGRLDGAMTRDEVLAHVAELAGGHRTCPLSADLENCFADDPEGVAAHHRRGGRRRRGRVLGGGLHRPRGRTHLRRRPGRGAGARRRPRRPTAASRPTSC